MGTPKLPRWYASDIGSEFVLSNGERTEHVRGEHCKACALVKVIVKHGGDTDLRGLSAYGMCYQMLAITVRAARDREYELEIDPSAHLSIAEQSEAYARMARYGKWSKDRRVWTAAKSQGDPISRIKREGFAIAEPSA